MQCLLILVVLMIVMCMFNKTREMFIGFSGYGRFNNAFCKLTNKKPESIVTEDITQCRDTCDDDKLCRGFNAIKRFNKYICMYSTDDMKHCGDPKNRPKVGGGYYYFKTPKKDAASLECEKLARDKVLGFRKAAIEAINNIR